MTSSQWSEASQKPAAEEQRGGDKPDWANAKPGEPLPGLPGITPEQDAAWKEMVALGEELQGGKPE